MTFAFVVTQPGGIPTRVEVTGKRTELEAKAHLESLAPRATIEPEKPAEVGSDK